MTLGENRANIDLKANNLLGETISVTSRITADRFDLEPLLAAAGAPAAPAEKQEPGAEIGPFDLPLLVNGSIELGRTVYRGLQVENFDCRYRLEKNIFTIDKLTGRFAGGAFNQTARVDLRKPGLAYQTKLDLTGIQADPLVSALFPRAAGTTFGNLNLKASLEGAGTLTETLRRNLSGTGELLLADGRLTGSDLLQGLAQFLKVEELRTLEFEKASGNFTVRDGRVQITSNITGSNVTLQPRGSVGLDGSLDISLNTSLAPELTNKIDIGGISRFLTDDKGWGQLPIRVAGTMDSPRFALDTAAVQEKAKGELQKKLQEKVLDRLAPSQPDQPEGTATPKEQGRKLLEDSLRGIFK
jgi:AsmA protein